MSKNNIIVDLCVYCCVKYSLESWHLLNTLRIIPRDYHSTLTDLITINDLYPLVCWGERGVKVSDSRKSGVSQVVYL